MSQISVKRERRYKWVNYICTIQIDFNQYTDRAAFTSVVFVFSWNSRILDVALVEIVLLYIQKCQQNCFL